MPGNVEEQNRWQQELAKSISEDSTDASEELNKILQEENQGRKYSCGTPVLFWSVFVIIVIILLCKYFGG